jgi:endonuclease/exonuclease/phosphatase family metal-dependent hydrolase
MATSGMLKIATFNLYNLQIPEKPIYYGRRISVEEYERKLDWTARTLRLLNADVIGFQELWDPQALVDAFDRMGLGEDYHLVVNEELDFEASTALAIRRSTCEHVSTRWVKEFPDELRLVKRKPANFLEPNYEMAVDVGHFSRALLRVRVRPPQGPDIVFFVAHLKSKLPIQLDQEEQDLDEVRAHSTAIGSALATIRRAAEAAALRVILDKLMKSTDTPIVVMGDLNDSQLSITTSIITGTPKYRLFAKSRVGSRSDKGLYSVATLQEHRSLRDVYYSYLHEGMRESLDHILVSEQFYDYSVNRVWSFREMLVLNDHLDIETPGASDHGVISSTFDYNPAD